MHTESCLQNLAIMQIHSLKEDRAWAPVGSMAEQLEAHKYFKFIKKVGTVPMTRNARTNARRVYP
jgi:hypothetical protein